jgi:hypothetical protein
MSKESAFDWFEAIQVWVKEDSNSWASKGPLLKELFDRTTQLAATVIWDFKTNAIDAGDLAVEFLLGLRREGNVYWSSGQGVKKALRSHYLKNHREAHYEVMDITRKALKTLEEGGSIIREAIGENGGRVTNDDRWLHRNAQAKGISFQNEREPGSVVTLVRDEWRLMLKSGGLVLPKMTQRKKNVEYSDPENYQSQDEKRRLLKPVTAQKLIERVLLHSEASATTGDLHKGLCIVLAALDFEEMTPPPADDDKLQSAADYHRGTIIPYRIYEFLDWEAEKRGAKLGGIFCHNDLCHVFKTYSLVEDATLEGTGYATSTANEKHNKIKTYIKEVLPMALQLEIAEDALDRVGNIGDFSDKDQIQQFQVLFFIRAMENAVEFCRKNCPSTPSKRSKTK